MPICELFYIYPVLVLKIFHIGKEHAVKLTERLTCLWEGHSVIVYRLRNVLRHVNECHLQRGNAVLVFCLSSIIVTRSRCLLGTCLVLWFKGAKTESMHTLPKQANKTHKEINSNTKCHLLWLLSTSQWWHSENVVSTTSDFCYKLLWHDLSGLLLLEDIIFSLSSICDLYGHTLAWSLLKREFPLRSADNFLLPPLWDSVQLGY